MPNIHDVLEPILADLEACEEAARTIVNQRHFDGVGMGDLASMARICASLRPVLEQANELAADMDIAESRVVEVLEASREQMAAMQARIAELEAQLAEVRKGFAP